jgi:hypothetical protein
MGITRVTGFLPFPHDFQHDSASSPVEKFHLKKGDFGIWFCRSSCPIYFRAEKNKIATDPSMASTGCYNSMNPFESDSYQHSKIMTMRTDTVTLPRNGKNPQCGKKQILHVRSQIPFAAVKRRLAVACGETVSFQPQIIHAAKRDASNMMTPILKTHPDRRIRAYEYRQRETARAAREEQTDEML